MNRIYLIAFSLLSFFLPNTLNAEQPKGPQHGLDLYGTPGYPKDFKNFDYVNPNAPKGGKLVMGAVGTFDSLNPFVIKGVHAAGMQPIYSSYQYATLMEPNYNEPMASYGYIAETVEVAEDQKSVTYVLRETAKFHDGSPIMAEDVVFTFNTLMKDGNPFYRSYYRKVAGVEALESRKVRFNFSTNDDKELAILTGQLPILSKSFYTKHDFKEANFTRPLGSGPYEIEKVDAGKSITYKRAKDWWGADLPVNKGRYNFDNIEVIYFRDATVALEAFKSGDVNFRVEATAKDWANSYDSPAFRKGDYVKLEIPNTVPMGMSGLIFNIRKPMFQDINVRKALSLAFDFEWANKNLFYGAYTRDNSYFSNSELASKGLPQGDELKLLEPFKTQVPAEVFTQEFKMPVNQSTNDFREQLKKARELLLAAGWDMKDNTLINKATGKPFEIQILLDRPEYARIYNSYVQNLKTLGINASLRMVDTAQYQERLNEFDYDMIYNGFGQSISPGNEQEEFFSSKTADVKGSRNYIGVKNPIIDGLIEGLIKVQTREEQLNYVHAQDRVLLWNYYIVPGWYLGAYRLAHWKQLHGPSITPKYNFDINAWWYEDASK
jgi:microcin C transport system substrate-binding protein